MALFYSFYGRVIFHGMYVFVYLFIHSSVHGHLGCCYVLAIVNRGASINVFRIRVLSGHKPRRGTARLYANSVLSQM